MFCFVRERERIFFSPEKAPHAAGVSDGFGPAPKVAFCHDAAVLLYLTPHRLNRTSVKPALGPLLRERERESERLRD